MPIINCFIKKRKISFTKLQKALRLWSKDTHIEEKQICLTVLQSQIQVGKQYEIMIHLILPSIWNTKVKTTQLSLVKHISECLSVDVSEIFLFTSIINSGNVIEKGEVIEWKL